MFRQILILSFGLSKSLLDIIPRNNRGVINSLASVCSDRLRPTAVFHSSIQKRDEQTYYMMLPVIAMRNRLQSYCFFLISAKNTGCFSECLFSVIPRNVDNKFCLLNSYRCFFANKGVLQIEILHYLLIPF